MFYPDLTRREEYKKKNNNQYYSDYSCYREEITEDCQYRCVYCDIALEEMGGEGMQLDHFIPKDLGTIEPNIPTNLVLSCPKCNRLKSNHWPTNPAIAFIDPFSQNRIMKYRISTDGIISDNRCTRTEYKIRLLELNRPSRVQLRRSRYINLRIKKLIDHISDKMEELIRKIDESSEKEILLELKKLLSINKQLSTLI